jgi:dipeptidyl aminopeptidase/acylaminoacyl peptidase
MKSNVKNFIWKRFLVRLLIALIGTWIILFISLSLVYVARLLHPSCAPSPEELYGFESITVQTRDKLNLNGWWLPPKNGKVILLLGGLGSNRDTMLPDAGLLMRHGYGVITLDYRHCAGRITTLGYREIYELEAMINFSKTQPGVKRIGVLGFSVGGATALRGAARFPEIEAVIAEGNYANLYDEITATPTTIFSVEWQLQQLVIIGYWLRTGINPVRVSPISDVPRISPRPILFIHGENEINRSRGHDQYTAAGENSQLWVVPDTGHGGYLQTHPILYEATIIDFLDGSFADDP